MKLDGIHHISAITGDAAGNVEFYTGVPRHADGPSGPSTRTNPPFYHLFLRR